MADGVDASLHAVQATRAEAVVDRVLAEPEGAKLAAGHDAVLRAGEVRDLAIDRMRSTFPAHVPGFVECVGHVAIVADEV